MKQTRKNNDINSQNVFAAMKFKFGPSLFRTDLDLSYGYYTSERGLPDH